MFAVAIYCETSGQVLQASKSLQLLLKLNEVDEGMGEYPCFALYLYVFWTCKKILVRSRFLSVYSSTRQDPLSDTGVRIQVHHTLSSSVPSACTYTAYWNQPRTSAVFSVRKRCVVKAIFGQELYST